MPPILNLNVHFSTNEPIIKFQSKNGFLKPFKLWIKCISPNKRKLDRAEYIANCLLDHSGNPIFKSSHQIKQLFDDVNIFLIWDEINKIIESISPSIINMTVDDYNELMELIEKQMASTEFMVEKIKASYCEKINEYWGLPINELNDVRFLIWMVIKKLENKSEN